MCLSRVLTLTLVQNAIMRIDRAKLKKSLSDPPADCALLIQKLCIQSNDELRATLPRDLK